MTVRISPQPADLGEALAYASALQRAGLVPATLAGRLLSDIAEAVSEIDLPPEKAAEICAGLARRPVRPPRI